MTVLSQNLSQNQSDSQSLQANTDGQGGSPWDEMWFFTQMILAAMGFVAIGISCMYLLITENREVQRELNCINAACDKPCDGKKLKRHEGCK
jgi:hypothetical protein